MALLCQKVENYVVGAPCGVMDQMASACGEANKLLAMICQVLLILLSLHSHKNLEIFRVITVLISTHCSLLRY